MLKVKWGMIGTGSVTEVKSGPGFYKCEHSELKGVYNRNLDKAVDWANRHGISKIYKSVEEMLADDIDAVYIATPPNAHKEYAIKCIEAGKIPYIEKPMALDYNECLEIMDKSKEYNIPVYVAYYRRGMDKYKKIKELLDNKVIGNIRYVEVRQIMKPEPTDYDMDNLPWRIKPEVTGGGKFIDMGVHVLDILDFFFGHITEATGIAKNLGGLYYVEDTVSASFSFENGVIGNGMWCYVADHEEEYVKIAGDKGYMVFGGLGFGKVGQVSIYKDSKTEVLEFINPNHVAQPYIQMVINEILGIEKGNANIESAANVTRVTDEILKDFKKHYKR
jgi:predicted dehydrogenase